jgi:hypothetical protein
MTVENMAQPSRHVVWLMKMMWVINWDDGSRRILADMYAGTVHRRMAYPSMRSMFSWCT